MSNQTLSERLSQQIVALELRRLPGNVVAAAKLHVLDSIGCLLAGSRLEPGRLAYQLATASSRGEAQTATLIGTEQRVALLEAVQAMAAAAHCGELDDIHGGAGACIGAIVIPALLATAEEHGGSGTQLVEAAIAGYETIVRVGLSIDAPKLFARGWWPSTVCGAFGVVSAGGKFLGWPADRLANALGIASLLSGGMLTGGNEGASARHLAFGRAAQNGLVALRAAEQGLTGPKLAFEDARGFGATLSPTPRWEFFDNFDNFYLPEVAFKPYPCARQLHAGVEALLNLLERHGIAPSAISGIDLALPAANAAMVNRPATPKLRAATLGSGQYVMAVTALRGGIDLQSFEPEFLENQTVHALMAKVTVTSDSELDRHFPKYWSGRVTVKLTGGQTCSEQILAPKGEPENPMAQEDVEEKFLGLARAVLGDAKAAAVLRTVGAMDSDESVVPLLTALSLRQN